MKKVTILLVDDHPVVRQGLSALINMEEDMEIVGEADNGRAAVAVAKRTHPEVVIMDLSMPLLNGAEATRQIHQTVPSVKVLVLSSFGDDEYVERLMQAGAAGYLTKESAADELIKAVRKVHSGKPFFSPRIAKRLRQRSDGSPAGGQPARTRPGLSPRQTEVLQLIARGFANKQIAVELGTSIKTVEKQRQAVMKKLDVHETAGLTRYAIAKKLVV
jgi:DNA-binding NarL/FixJ family response regulator